MALGVTEAFAERGLFSKLAFNVVEKWLLHFTRYGSYILRWSGQFYNFRMSHFLRKSCNRLIFHEVIQKKIKRGYRARFGIHGRFTNRRLRDLPCVFVIDMYSWPKSKCVFPPWLSTARWIDVAQSSALYVTNDADGDVMLLDQRRPTSAVTNHSTAQVCPPPLLPTLFSFPIILLSFLAQLW